MDAVKQWTYKPYLLNGSPTAVDTQIVVNYNLGSDPAPAQQSTFAGRSGSRHPWHQRSHRPRQLRAIPLPLTLSACATPPATRGVTKDPTQAAAMFQRAIAVLQPAAEKGDPIAEYMMGLMSFLGQGLPLDNAKAVEWLQKSADQNYPTALTTLALAYEYARLGPHRRPRPRPHSLAQGR